MCHADTVIDSIKYNFSVYISLGFCNSDVPQMLRMFKEMLGN